MQSTHAHIDMETKCNYEKRQLVTAGHCSTDELSASLPRAFLQSDIRNACQKEKLLRPAPSDGRPHRARPCRRWRPCAAKDRSPETNSQKTRAGCTSWAPPVSGGPLLQHLRELPKGRQVVQRRCGGQRVGGSLPGEANEASWVPTDFRPFALRFLPSARSRTLRQAAPGTDHLWLPASDSAPVIAGTLLELDGVLIAFFLVRPLLPSNATEAEQRIQQRSWQPWPGTKRILPNGTVF